MLSESERLQKIIESEQMTAKQFSEEVGIQPGTVSNILKGRNNPSLEVMQKILERFRTISSDWLILGVGAMYRQKNDSQQPVLFDLKPETNSISESLLFHDRENLTQELTSKEKKMTLLSQNEKPVQHHKIIKVIIFYDDGTYEEVIKNKF